MFTLLEACYLPNQHTARRILDVPCRSNKVGRVVWGLCEILCVLCNPEWSRTQPAQQPEHVASPRCSGSRSAAVRDTSCKASPHVRSCMLCVLVGNGPSYTVIEGVLAGWGTRIIVWAVKEGREREGEGEEMESSCCPTLWVSTVRLPFLLIIYAAKDLLCFAKFGLQTFHLSHFCKMMLLFCSKV